MAINRTILLLAALLPALAFGVEPGTYHCGYVEGATGAITVTVEPKDTDVQCTVGAVSAGTHTVKVSAKPPATGGSAEVTLTFALAAPPVPPSTDPDPHGTTIPPAAAITDAAKAVWTVSGGKIFKDGAVLPSSSVDLLLWHDGVIHQRNSFGGWWRWNGSAWIGVAGDPRAPSP